MIIKKLLTVLTAFKPIKFNFVCKHGTYFSLWVVCERNKLFFGELWRKVLKTQKYKSKIRNHSVASFYQPSMKRRQIEACIYNCRIIKKKSIFFFSKQKGISCTACEQIGLFLISTRGCGSHSRKYLKNLICSRVQKIPYCFSNGSIFYV